MNDTAFVQRDDLAPVPGQAGARVAALYQISDLHLMDSVSPMRFEWIETLAADPRWHPLLHMHRPQEALVPWALAAHVDEIRSGVDQPVDLVISTGDNIDNAQRNELDAYLALMAGGRITLDPAGGVHDADPGFADEWPYWSPHADVANAWRARGYPVIDGWAARTAQPVVSAGLGVPWSSLPGNHDVLCQGTSVVSAALLSAALGSVKALHPPAGFQPDNPAALFVDEPEAFLGVGERVIGADPNRRPIDLNEWISAHASAGALGWFALNPATGRADTVIELDSVVLILLDTNHPYADYQGSVGSAQLAWLDAQLHAADAAGRLAVLASHHGVDALVNERGGDPDRLLSDALLRVAHRHPSLVLWLVGHRHINRIVARSGASGGFWEITTGSLIDWPCERRRIDLLRHGNGVIEIATSVQRANPALDTLAWWHLQLAHRFAGSRRRPSMEGEAHDRNARLFLTR